MSIGLGICHRLSHLRRGRRSGWRPREIASRRWSGGRLHSSRHLGKPLRRGRVVIQQGHDIAGLGLGRHHGWWSDGRGRLHWRSAVVLWQTAHIASRPRQSRKRSWRGWRRWVHIGHHTTTYGLLLRRRLLLLLLLLKNAAKGHCLGRNGSSGPWRLGSSRHGHVFSRNNMAWLRW